jgi:cleavage and polyadenylation specificity factor subunit 3
MNGAVLPEKPVDILLLESTYGATDSLKIGDWKSNTERFMRRINKIVNSGGSVLIPTFSLGKLQEILHLIIKLQIKNRISEADIYFGGIGKSICSLYDANQYLVKRNDKNFEFKDHLINDYYLVKDLTHFRKNPSIILASSGMMVKGTYSYKAAKYFIKQKDFGIFTVGYMDPESPGFKIQSSAKGDDIIFENERLKVECSIERFYFNSHSKSEELIEIVDRLKPSKIILLHGEPEAKSQLGYGILEKSGKVALYSAEIGKDIILS